MGDQDEQAAPKGLHQRMQSIMEDCQRIEKDATNPHHKYEYASERAIKEAIHPLLVKHGVLFRMEITGKPELISTGFLVPMAYIFSNVDDPTQNIVGQWYGTGAARDEKGLYAAITGAIKYALTTCLLIPTGDDPEKDEAPKVAKRVTKKAVSQTFNKVPSKTELDRTNEAARQATGTKPKQTKKQVADKLLALMKTVVGGTRGDLEDFLEHITGWVDDDGVAVPGKRSMKDMSEKAIFVTHAKLREAIAKGDYKPKE